MNLSVAVDGPAGAGKSTIAKILSKNLNLMYINTGAMYRAVTLMAIKNNIMPEAVEDILKLTESLEMHFEGDNLILNGEDVSERVNMPDISEKVSSYASIPLIREKMVKAQREIAKNYNVIMDGRDIGTVVLKDAPFKFFLTASAEKRAERRCKELLEKNIKVEYEKVLSDIIERDYADTHREVDPLKKAASAIEIDCTYLSIEEVVEKITCCILNSKNN